MMDSELPEYRIYVGRQGSTPVMTNIVGDQELERQLKLVRDSYPDDTIYVREVLETVRYVLPPNPPANTV